MLGFVSSSALPFFFFFLCFRCIYLKGRVGMREVFEPVIHSKWPQRQGWARPQAAAFSGSCTQVQQPTRWHCVLLPFQVHWQGNRSEVEQLTLELVSVGCWWCHPAALPPSSLHFSALASSCGALFQLCSGSLTLRIESYLFFFFLV